MPCLLEGRVRNCGFVNKRRYFLASLDFGTARRVLRSDPYVARTGQGEQRAIVDAHARKIRKAIEADQFTPVALHAGLRPSHRDAVQVEQGGVRLVVDDAAPLPLTDGGHRLHALKLILDDAEAAVASATTDAERERAEEFVGTVLGQPIEVFVLLDGEPQQDFINLQVGRAVDKGHLLSLRVQHKMFTGKDRDVMNRAFEIANLLASDRNSPFYRMVKFDSRGMAPLPINTLCNDGVEAAGSLVGLARLGLLHGWNAERLAGCVLGVCRAVAERAPELAGEDMPLEPPPDGPKGGTYMILGVALALAFRVAAGGGDTASEDDLDRLVAAARRELGSPIKWNASMAKRAALGRFVAAFLADLDCKKHQGVPVGLFEAVTPSAYSLPPVPKAAKLPKPPRSPLPDAHEAAPAVPDEPTAKAGQASAACQAKTESPAAAPRPPRPEGVAHLATLLSSRGVSSAVPRGNDCVEVLGASDARKLLDALDRDVGERLRLTFWLPPDDLDEVVQRLEGGGGLPDAA
jgi:hypothetical protein